MAFDWENMKDTLLNKIFRSVLVKWVQRGVTYGFGFLMGALALQTPSSDEQAKIVEYVVSGVLLLLGMGIDYLHHRLDNSFVLPHPVLFIPDDTGKPDGPYVPVQEDPPVTPGMVSAENPPQNP